MAAAAAGAAAAAAAAAAASNLAADPPLDELVFVEEGPAAGAGGPLNLDPATGAAAPVPIPDLQAGQRCTVVVSLVARSVQPFHLRAALVYSNAKQCEVATAPPASFGWRCANAVEARHVVDYVRPNVWPWLAAGEPFVVRSECVGVLLVVAAAAAVVVVVVVVVVEATTQTTRTKWP